MTTHGRAPKAVETPPSPASELQYASFGRRVGGYAVDAVILAVVAGFPAAILQAFGGGLVGLVITVTYVALLNAHGGTAGKRVLGMRLQDKTNGENIGVGRSMIRFVVAIPSALVFLLGYLWCIRDPSKQAWHDKAAGSVVVRT